MATKFDPAAFIDDDALAAVSVSDDGSEPEEDAYATAAVSRRRVENKFDILCVVLKCINEDSSIENEDSSMILQ